MHELLPGLIVVLALIGVASIAAPRVKLPAPVLVAIAGVGWALLPGYRELMTDRLAELRAIDDRGRENARRLVEVSREVRRAVWQAETEELLRLRNAAQINDHDHQNLQLEIDREYTDLIDGSHEAATMRMEGTA